MLIANLLPLLGRYSLGLDLVAGPGDTVTLTIIPRKREGATSPSDANETCPIAITAPAHEIDAELALGKDGALGQLIASRKALADQIADQRQAAEVAKQAASSAAATKAPPPVPKAAAPAPAKAPAPTSPPAGARADEPATLF